MMMTMIRWAAAMVVMAAPALADAPTVRIAVLKFGTVNWLTETIRSQGHDAANGFTLETVGLAGRDASTIAFQAGDVDMFVADWLWVMNQRERGKDFRFFPYSRALGALMAMPDGPQTLCDLPGATVGVVGGAMDKSWLVYRALAARDCDADLVAETETLFGAPPLMSKQLTDGNAEAVSTYWHFAAKLRAAGARDVIDVAGALAALDIAPAPPLIGFVWSPGRTDPALTERLAAAVRAAAAQMRDDDALWDTLRPMMRAKTDAEFVALREAFQAGVIAAPWTAEDTEAARATHATLVAAGGAAFARDAGVFDAGAFPDPVSN